MEPIVSVTGGKIRGATSGGVQRFLGVPYAAAPVGPARFRLPERAPEWSGVRDALAPGATCAQSPYPPPIHALLGSDGIPGDEYLNVNVWTPDSGGSGLPVMVWIHGGAFTRGSNARVIYDGTAFARDGVVLVSINYRLGISGFAAVADAPLNRGLHDQLFALRWVQENVEAFGGDPGNITIFGESAGGMSVATLVASPRSAELFQRAIMQSGNGSAVATVEDARRVADELARKLGIAATAADFGKLGPDELRAAQDAIGLELMLDPNPARWGSSIIANGIGVLSLFPVIDDDVVPGVPLNVLATHPDRAVPLITGCTTEEFRFFTVPTGIAAGVTAENLPALLARYGIPPEVADVYTANRPGRTPADVFADLITDRAFRLDTLDLAEINAAAGAPAYAYEFACPSGIDGLGACHVMEVPFVFDALACAHRLTGPNPPQLLADEIHSAWVAFAETGDPGWPRFHPDTAIVRTFDTPESRNVSNPRGDELAALRAALRPA
ncbi:carboxylesterase/lipase family protein [Nocardia huaxiensis]|uniref:Carboxylic ester hydrolase n=1 Tax=Nocardia huaxiensis TaxID=2755382 RepID=A0A7D6VG68_9NOCA|nr:carboxylesterase family protein [Nocardia huaxiensis]QLY28890.1 carboxylesterase/lipase family protein [Nocardia huaxiensis]UFS97634.1 carboxylesterase family protein [Nocardia huaxiensis]